MAQKPSYSEPEYAQATKRNEDYPWYLSSIDKYLRPSTQDLLENYSKIPRDQQSDHVHKIRDEACAIRHYPCTGLGVWLVPYIATSPAYNAIMQRLKQGDRMMDVGCFLGQDFRRLVYDGAPSENMYGIDIVSHWSVGFSLFRDQDHFKAHFIEADIMSDDNFAMQALKGTVDIISISAVLHQWNWDDQVWAAKRLVSYSKPGALVVGHQVGNANAEHITLPPSKVPQWRHSPASFEKLWDQVGAETNTVWETKARLITFDDVGWDAKDAWFLPKGDQVLDFVVTRKQ